MAGAWGCVPNAPPARMFTADEVEVRPVDHQFYGRRAPSNPDSWFWTFPWWNAFVLDPANPAVTYATKDCTVLPLESFQSPVLDELTKADLSMYWMFPRNLLGGHCRHGYRQLHQP